MRKVHKLNNKKDSLLEGGNRLIEAVKNENLSEASRIVEDNPASVLEVDHKTKRTALHIACYNALSDFVTIILNSPEVDFESLDGNKHDVLQAAMSSGDTQTIQLVYDAINARAPHVLNNPPSFDMDDFQ